MINHELKCIFVHIIKTGGVSIANALEMEQKQCHLSAHDIRKIVGEKIWNSYFKFTIIRNPWDKMVSSYHYNHHKWVPKETTFEDYIKNWGNGMQVTRFPPQNAPYINEKLDFIGRFETLEEDFLKILDHIGQPKRALPRLNQSQHLNYRNYYSEKTRRIVKHQFATDIKIWGFEY